MQGARTLTERMRRVLRTTPALAMTLLAVPAAAQKPAARTPTTPPTAAATLDRIKAAGRIRLGFRADARPFSFRDQPGDPAGYTVGLCLNVAEAVRTAVGNPSLVIEWVPVTLETRFTALEQGQVDLLCGAESITLARRQEVAFSTPIFPGGIGALVRSDAPTRVKDILNGRQPPAQPNWRASAVQTLQTQVFAVIGGTTAEAWLAGKVKEFKLTSKTVPVDGYDAGVQAVQSRKATVFFGDRAILLDAAARSANPGALVVLERQFTAEPIALAMRRGDEDFRLLVDRALSALYARGEFADLYRMYFGPPDAATQAFFRWNTVPE